MPYPHRGCITEEPYVGNPQVRFCEGHKQQTKEVDKMSTRRIPTISQQMFGDVNKRLNNIRAKMNEKIKEKCFETLERKKELKGGEENRS